MTENNKWQDKTVLIVDDSVDICDKLREIYEYCGLKVVDVAHDGVQALEILAKEAVDLVSLDIIMPNMDGIECYRKIKELYPNLQCLVLSKLCDEESAQESLLEIFSANQIVAKNLTHEHLEAHLKNL